MALQQLGFKPPLTKENRVALMETLHSMKFQTFYGTIEFGKDGANVAHPPVAVQIQNGKLENVFPLEYAQAKVWYPFKPWKQR